MTRTKKIIAVVAIAVTSTLGVGGVAFAHHHDGHRGHHRGHHHGDGIVRDLVDILSDVL